MLKFGDKESIKQVELVGELTPGVRQLAGMHLSFGQIEGKKCADCAHYAHISRSDKPTEIAECALCSHSTGQRFRRWQPDWQACGKFEE